MAKPEDRTPSAGVKGALPDALVSIISVKWDGSSLSETIDKDATGRLGSGTASRTWRSGPRAAPGASTANRPLFRLMSEVLKRGQAPTGAPPTGSSGL